MTLFESDGGPPRHRSQSLRRRTGLVALLTASIGALLLAFWPSGPFSNPYTMPTDVAQIADRLGFTEEGRSIFMGARPELLEGEEFHRACNPTEEKEPERGLDTIGCYYGIGTTGRIAIFRPADERLANQVFVTAAHEFLHAAYGQLPSDEQARLDALLEARWSLIPADDPIQARFASSVKGLAENRATEQFAYLGTEIADELDPALEEYYARYFHDRQAVVALHNADPFLGENADFEPWASAGAR